MNSQTIIQELENIVGKDFASNQSEDLYIYSQDPGASIPRPTDFVVLPKSVEEVQKIIKFANKEKIPIIPMGGGLTLSGLVIPIKGGIVIDMKRMNKIIEINETSRYALLEAGVTTGQLLSYLNNNFPQLQPPIPDAPPSATITGNVLIHGSGYLSQKHGDHGSMINGLEVVLPNGDVGKFGSCAISDYWFSRGPIPDFIGLFTSSFGTLGIVTKLSIKLYPKPKFREVVFGLMKDINELPNLLLSITKSGLAEDILLGMQDKPEWMKGYVFVMTYITGETDEDMSRNLKILKKIYRKANTRFMKPPDRMRETYLEKPIFAAGLADIRKGGGFEYVGCFMPLERVPEAYLKAAEISRKYNVPPTIGSRLMSGTHTIIVFFSYAFNRADPKDLENARNALHETNELALELGGIPWKVELDGQQLVLEKMNPTYKKVLKLIKNALDPNGIMNPGNWEEIR
jgi:glycolate oxidase